MTIQELQEHIPSDRVDGKMPGEEKYRWIKIEELLSLSYYIVYGDPGGDTFIKIANNEEKFNKMLQKHMVDGDTNCDFATEIYLIVKNGEKYTPTII